MKPQDIAFVVTLAVLLFLKKPIVFVYTGLICILLSIALYSRWVFFTGERLIWYAVFYFFVFSILMLLNKHKESL